MAIRHRPLGALARAPCRLLAAPGCGGPAPSRVPLGVGPLPAGYRLGETKKPAHADRKAPPERPASTVAKAASAAPESDASSGKTNGTESKTAAADQSATGTGKTPPPPSAPDPAKWLGDYRGDDVSTYRLSGMPDREEKDPNARITVKSSDKTSVDLVLVDSSNGKDICTLVATLGVAGATVTPGQKCFEQNGGDASATASIKTGTATLDGARLVVDLSLDFEMHVPDQDATGTLDYHFDGTRR